MPLISIITVTYNAALTIEPTLDSVEAQSFRDFEYLVIDGASTDDTLRLVSGCRLAHIVSEPDCGLYDAMNKGLHRANGKYVIFLNAGDSFYATDTLQRYADAIKNSSVEPGVIYGQTRIVDKNRNFIGERHLLAPQNLNSQSFLNGMVVCHQAMLVRRDIAPDYDLNYKFSADYDWGCKILKVSPLNVYIPDYVVDYLSEGLTTSNHRASLKERFRAMSSNYGIFPAIISHLKKLLK